MGIDYKLIGERIKTKRKIKGYTQETLAEKLDVSVGYVSQVERGVTKISLELLGEISGFLECDIAELITGSATSVKNYMNTELEYYFSRMSSEDRKLLTSIAQLMVNNKRNK